MSNSLFFNPAEITRGFAQNEYEERLARTQAQMHKDKLDAILLTAEPEVRYYTGFQTQFWESPTRPWFTIIPADGKPIAIIPEIGYSGMAETWITDIRTWPAPQPEDDGISLLAQAFKELPKKYGNIGAALGFESILRMPAQDFEILRKQISPASFVNCSALLQNIRFVKSAAEIKKIHRICDLVSLGFETLPQQLQYHIEQNNQPFTEREACKIFRKSLLDLGADHSPYMIAGSGYGGYDSIIMGPTDRVIESGDIMIIDTGTLLDGYLSDFDRNFAFITKDQDLSSDTLKAYETVFNATEAGFKAARPDVTMAELYQAMWQVLEKGGALSNNVGRMGHGLGLQLTEGPSITPHDHTPLQVGSVITLEPGMEFAPQKQMVHEENIVITEDGAKMLSRRAPEIMPIIKLS